MFRRYRKAILNFLPTVIKTGILDRMPALYPFLEIQPASCNIMITDRCNLRCIMCKQWQKPHREELSAEDWKRVITDLQKNRIRNIHFTGGEPLLRSDIKDLIAYAGHKGLSVGLTTNGTLLTHNLLETLIDAGLRSVAVSLDGLNEEYERIRGVPGSFKRVEQAVYLLARMRMEKKIDAYINFVLMRGTIKNFRTVKQFADQMRLPAAICLLDKHSSIFSLEENKAGFWIQQEDAQTLEDFLAFLREEKRKAPRSLLLNFPMIEFVKSYFHNPLQERILCVSSQDRIIIDPYGNLLGGCLSMGSFGNLKEKTFRQLKKDTKYQQAKKKMFYKKCAGCSCGYQFNIRCLPQFIVKDLWMRWEKRV